MAASSAPQQNPWFSVSVGLMGLIVGYVLGTSVGGGGIKLPSVAGPTPSAPSAPSEPTPQNPPEVGVGPVIGSSRAKVTVVEFTDYQCPFCSRHFNQTYGQLKSGYIDTGKIKYESRSFPLVSIHPQATPASEAALCANKQGKFWEMHEKLFVAQTQWSGNADAKGVFKKFASELGLNASSFASCLDSGEMNDQVQEDLAAGSDAGVNGTPAFWVISDDGKSKFISGAQPYANFQAAIDAML